MNNFFRRNQKKLLAILGSFLMIVFIIPFAGNRGTGGTREDVVVAYAGADKIHASDLAHAKADWDLLMRLPARAPRVAVQMGRQYDQPVPYPYQLGIGTAMEVEQSPELFVLLQKEADRFGIKVPPERVELTLRDINLSPNMPAEDAERFRHAIEAFLKVKGLYDRVTSNVKVSEPVVAKYVAQSAQEVKLNLVEFDAGAAPTTAPATGPATGPATAVATAPTTAPSQQELEAHFQKYANRAPGLPSTNPATLTFGYQRPDRVKVQYIAVRRDQIRDAVRKTKEPYEWEVAAQRYYLAHQRDFPVTQPASKPATTQSTTQSTTRATQPAAPAATTRPFQEVREQVTERVLEPEVDKLARQVSDAIAERLAADWEKFQPKTTAPSTGPTTTASTAPATAPASTQPGGIGSFAYLEQVAADIQKRFGVLPAVTSKSDQWLSADDLAKLPGIGSAHRAESGESFANYVIQSAEPFLPVPQKADASAVLKLLQPSRPIEDADHNVYFFRVTEAERAHAPQGLAEVREQVESDYRAARAYERAIAEATKFIEAAKKEGLAKAAAAAGKQVIATGTIGRGLYGLPPMTIPSYPTTPETRQALVAQSAQLLSQATPDAPHPVALVEVPEDRKVIVAELGDVSTRYQPEQLYASRLFTANTLEYQQTQDLVAEWFNDAAVKARLQYKPVEEYQKSKKDRTRTASAS